MSANPRLSYMSEGFTEVDDGSSICSESSFYSCPEPRDYLTTRSDETTHASQLHRALLSYSDIYNHQGDTPRPQKKYQSVIHHIQTTNDTNHLCHHNQASSLFHLISKSSTQFTHTNDIDQNKRPSIHTHHHLALSQQQDIQHDSHSHMKQTLLPLLDTQKVNLGHHKLNLGHHDLLLNSTTKESTDPYMTCVLSDSVTVDADDKSSCLTPPSHLLNQFTPQNINLNKHQHALMKHDINETQSFITRLKQSFDVPKPMYRRSMSLTDLTKRKHIKYHQQHTLQSLSSLSFITPSSVVEQDYQSLNHSLWLQLDSNTSRNRCYILPSSEPSQRLLYRHVRKPKCTLINGPPHSSYSFPDTSLNKINTAPLSFSLNKQMIHLENTTQNNDMSSVQTTNPHLYSNSQPFDTTYDHQFPLTSSLSAHDINFQEVSQSTLQKHTMLNSCEPSISLTRIIHPKIVIVPTKQEHHTISHDLVTESSQNSTHHHGTQLKSKTFTFWDFFWDEVSCEREPRLFNSTSQFNLLTRRHIDHPVTMSHQPNKLPIVPSGTCDTIPKTQMRDLFYIPLRLEKMFALGFCLCLECLLYELTLMPIQAITATYRIFRLCLYIFSKRILQKLSHSLLYQQCLTQRDVIITSLYTHTLYMFHQCTAISLFIWNLIKELFKTKKWIFISFIQHTLLSLYQLAFCIPPIKANCSADASHSNFFLSQLKYYWNQLKSNTYVTQFNSVISKLVVTCHPLNTPLKKFYDHIKKLMTYWDNPDQLYCQQTIAPRAYETHDPLHQSEESFSKQYVIGNQNGYNLDSIFHNHTLDKSTVLSPTLLSNDALDKISIDKDNGKNNFKHLCCEQTILQSNSHPICNSSVTIFSKDTCYLYGTTKQPIPSTFKPMYNPFKLPSYFLNYVSFFSVPPPLLTRPQACDLTRTIILILGIWVFNGFVDVSEVYHFIRAQSLMKLYVVFNMLEIFERLWRSLGRDALDSLMRQVIALPGVQYNESVTTTKGDSTIPSTSRMCSKESLSQNDFKQANFLSNQSCTNKNKRNNEAMRCYPLVNRINEVFQKNERSDSISVMTEPIITVSKLFENTPSMDTPKFKCRRTTTDGLDFDEKWKHFSEARSDSATDVSQYSQLVQKNSITYMKKKAARKLKQRFKSTITQSSDRNLLQKNPTLYKRVSNSCLFSTSTPFNSKQDMIINNINSTSSLNSDVSLNQLFNKEYTTSHKESLQSKKTECNKISLYPNSILYKDVNLDASDKHISNLSCEPSSFLHQYSTNHSISERGQDPTRILTDKQSQPYSSITSNGVSAQYPWKEMFYNWRKSTSNIRRFFLYIVLALIYVVVHSFTHLMRVLLLNIAINSSDSVMFLIVTTNNFAEIKSTVFKKFTKTTLFPIVASDAVERFYLFTDGLLVMIRMATSVRLPLCSYLTVTGWLVGMLILELFVDWFKHSFLLKLNFIQTTIFDSYRKVMLADILTCRIRTVPKSCTVTEPQNNSQGDDKHHQSDIRDDVHIISEWNTPCRSFYSFPHICSRRLGFIALPLTAQIFCCMPSFPWKSAIFAVSFTLLLLWISLIVLKVIVSMLLVSFGIQRRHTLEHMERDLDLLSPL